MRMLLPVLLLVVIVVVTYWVVVQARGVRSGPTAPRLTAGRAPDPARAAWKPAHRQAGGRTEVVLQRVRTRADAEVEVLEERPFDEWADDDPMWDARFAESMAAARHRCELMNTEEE
jgi:hypothetical protein